LPIDEIEQTVSQTRRRRKSLADRPIRVAVGRAQLAAAGAHEVIDAVADCDAALDAIEARIRRGERP
jgi:hypothetical protein